MNKDISFQVYKSCDIVNTLSVKEFVNSRLPNYYMLNFDSDHPLNVYNLSLEKIVVLVGWIKESFVVSRSRHDLSSYGLKHVFERSNVGFYVDNGMFKGAMILAGFFPYEGFTCGYRYSVFDTNWNFKVKFIGGVKK